MIGWMRLPLAVLLLLGVTLANRCASEAPHGPGTDSAVAEEPVETWLDPDWAAADESCVASTGVAGWLARKLPHYSARHIGLGAPLMGTTWLNRPMYVGGFLGESLGGTLVSGEVELKPGLFGGCWLGYDLSHYWGSEIRLGLNYADIEYLPAGGETGGNSRNALADINLLYYPWGDARWRPYGAVGLGIGGFHFDADPDMTIDHTGVSLPVGLGVKYLWGKQFVLRLDVKDNLIFGGHEVDTTHNWSLTGGFEFHWGSGTAAEYCPW